MDGFIFYVFITIAMPLSTYYYAKRNSRNPVLWAILGFFLPIFSHIVLYYIGTGRYGWPTVNQYLTAHPECNTGSGISCYGCGSKQIRGWGRAGIGDSSRLNSCNSCGRGLYVTN
jgi:hypothetical protein